MRLRRDQILFEDNHLLVVCKPAGMLTQSDKTGDTSLVDLATQYRIVNENKSGNAFVGLIHRLDRPVSGIVMLGKTSKGASRMSDQWRVGTVRKWYLALVRQKATAKRIESLSAGSGRWEDWLIKSAAENRVRRVKPSQSGSKQAWTTWRRLASAEKERLHLMLLEPVTGRSHQLRVACSERGWPMVGDVKYGSEEPGNDGSIALHAARLQCSHPTTNEPMTFQAPVPENWHRLARGLPAIDQWPGMIAEVT